ncbi:uncharacterized protein [Clytia hemisphaerica]|uniref:Uncharacterized protein n=1 Tax=Clytia hemisphaerica TaxID=252671 RepID=A0A7M5V7J1_9CNID
MEGIKDPLSKRPAVRGRGRGRGRGVLGMVDKNGNIKPAFQPNHTPNTSKAIESSNLIEVKTEPCQPSTHQTPPVTRPATPPVSPVYVTVKEEPWEPVTDQTYSSLNLPPTSKPSSPNPLLHDEADTLDFLPEPEPFESPVCAKVKVDALKNIQPTTIDNLMPSPNHRFFNDVSPNRIIEKVTKKKNKKKKGKKNAIMIGERNHQRPEEPIPQSDNQNKVNNRFKWTKEQQIRDQQKAAIRQDDFHWVKPDIPQKVTNEKPKTKLKPNQFHWTKDEQQFPVLKPEITSNPTHVKESDYVHLQNPETPENIQHKKSAATRAKKNDKFHWVKDKKPESNATKEHQEEADQRIDQLNKFPATFEKANREREFVGQKKKKEKSDWEKEKETWVRPENTVWSWYSHGYVDTTPMNIVEDSGIEKEPSTSPSEESVKQDEEKAVADCEEAEAHRQKHILSVDGDIRITKNGELHIGSHCKSPTEQQIKDISELFANISERRRERKDSTDIKSHCTKASMISTASTVQYATESFTDDIDRESYGTDKESYTTDKESYTTDKDSYATDKESFATDKETYGADREGYATDETEDYQYDDDEESFSDESNSDLSETGRKEQDSRRKSIPKFVNDRSYVSDSEEEKEQKKKKKQEQKDEKMRKDRTKEEVANITTTYNDTRGKQNNRLFKEITTGDGGGRYEPPYFQQHPPPVMHVERTREPPSPYKTTGRNNKIVWKSPMIYNWKNNSTEPVNQYGRVRKPSNVQSPKKKTTTKKYGIERIDQSSFPTLEAALNSQQNPASPSHNNPTEPKGGISYSQMASKPQDQPRPQAPTLATATGSRKAANKHLTTKSPAPKIASEEHHQPPTTGQEYQGEIRRSLKKKMKHQEENHEYNSSFSYEELAARVKDCKLQIIQATNESTNDQPIKTIPVVELEKQLKQPIEEENDSSPQMTKKTEEGEDAKESDEGFHDIDEKDDEKLNNERLADSILRFCFDAEVVKDIEIKNEKMKETKEVDLYKKRIHGDVLYHLASSIKTSSDYISNTLERRYPLWKTHWTPDRKDDQRFWNKWTIADELDFTFPVFDCRQMMKPLHRCKVCRL